MSGELRQIVDVDRRSAWSLELMVLFLCPGDGSERLVIKRFGVECLLVPMQPTMADQQGPSYIVSRTVANALASEAHDRLKRSRRMLGVLKEEVGRRENKTCILLPPKNFGREFERVRDCVLQTAGAARTWMGSQGGCGRWLQDCRREREDVAFAMGGWSSGLPPRQLRGTVWRRCGTGRDMRTRAWFGGICVLV